MKVESQVFILVMEQMGPPSPEGPTENSLRLGLQVISRGATRLESFSNRSLNSLWRFGELEKWSWSQQLFLWAGGDVWVSSESPGLPWLGALRKQDVLLLPGRVPVCLGLPHGSSAHHPEAR